MHDKSSAEAMRFAITVLPAPEVPMTTTRIRLLSLVANEDNPNPVMEPNVCCWHEAAVPAAPTNVRS
jgi:hypothetical protein